MKTNESVSHKHHVMVTDEGPVQVTETVYPFHFTYHFLVVNLLNDDNELT